MFDQIPRDLATLTEAKATIPTTVVITDEKLGRLLRHTSNLVRRITRHATYQTDNEGLPSSQVLRDIMRDATLTHLTAIVEHDLVDDVLTGGVTSSPALDSTSSNGKSLSFNNDTATGALARITAGGLTPEAENILGAVGLTSGMPGVLR